jgi:hypothetical protein
MTKLPALANESTERNRGVATLVPSLQTYRAILLVVVALTTYLYLPLVSGGRLLVPSFPTVVLMPLLFLTVRRSLREVPEHCSVFACARRDSNDRATNAATSVART